MGQSAREVVVTTFLFFVAIADSIGPKDRFATRRMWGPKAGLARGDAKDSPFRSRSTPFFRRDGRPCNSREQPLEVVAAALQAVSFDSEADDLALHGG